MNLASLLKRFKNNNMFNADCFTLSNSIILPEGKEYCAKEFELDGMKCMYREAKITPKKIGQFVTLWNRNSDGITQPFCDTDSFEWVFIVTKTTEELGVFIFPKSVLINQKILTSSKGEGKRGFRVYPSWDIAKNKQAIKTQIWQLNHFVLLEK